MEYQGTFTIGRRENIRFNLYVMRGRFILMAALVFVIIAVMLGASTYGQTMSVPAALLRGIPLGLGGAALFLVVNTVMLMTRINRAYKDQRAQEFTQDVTIGREGVRASSTRGAALLKWGNIVRVRESGKTFYLFLSKTQAYILPKYQLKDAAAEAGALRKRGLSPVCIFTGSDRELPGAREIYGRDLVRIPAVGWFADAVGKLIQGKIQGL